MHKITFIEPTWSGNIHLPANLGLLRVAHAAYPEALFNYVGEQSQNEMLQQSTSVCLDGKVRYVNWTTFPDSDSMPRDFLQRLARFKALPTDVLDKSELIVLTSCTATVLNVINWAGKASRCLAVLHGNANDLSGWRSRNPLRRWLDMTGALRRFCKRGGKVIVLEERIKSQLEQQLPWIAGSLHCIPHSLVPEEATASREPNSLDFPIRIGFAGLATAAKGFPDFLKLAQSLKEKRPGQYEFFAFGKVHSECAQQDQSALHGQTSTTSVPREAFIAGLKSMHYIFVWHQDNYYQNAASGVVYDAINLGIPMIARKASQISAWAESGLNIASSHDNLASAVEWLCKLDIKSEMLNYTRYCFNQSIIRERLSIENTASMFKLITNNIK